MEVKLTKLYRMLALALCLTLSGAIGLGEAAEPGSDTNLAPEEWYVDPFEAPVLEEAEFALLAEPTEQSAESDAQTPSGQAAQNAAQPQAEQATQDTAQPPEEQATQDAAQSPAEQASQDAEASETDPTESDADALEQRIFSETLAVDSAVWKNAELVRGEGFTGPFARVEGKLTLSNVTCGGAPIAQADLLSCFELGDTGRIAVEDSAPLSLSLSALSFNKGSRQTLKLRWNGSALNAKKAKWSSANTKIVKVSASGELTAKKKGTTTITVSYKGETATCRVVVTNIIQVKKVSLPSKQTVSLNATTRLKAKVSPDNATYPALTWSSSKPSVASVDEKGLVTGLSKGTAKITAKARNGKSATCTVTVKVIAPKSVDFAQLYVTMNPGGTYQTNAQLLPENASVPTLNYSSSDRAVATVDENGVITAVGCGTATITVKAAANEKIKNTCKVCVIEADAPRMDGLIIGINPGHQIKTITKLYPLAPGSHEKAKGVKTGACGRWTRVNEYETVLQIGLKLQKLLTQQGATVVMTRTTNDVNLTNIDRAKMLNAAGVDVALQLHCNSSSHTDHEGCSGYIRTTGNWVAESRALSKALTKAISQETGCVNLGVKVYNNYMSLNWTTTPSVLLEMGYLSNKKEDKLLATDSYRQEMAQGILEGLCDYFGR